MLLATDAAAAAVAKTSQSEGMLTVAALVRGGAAVGALVGPTCGRPIAAPAGRLLGRIAGRLLLEAAHRGGQSVAA